MTIFDDPSSQVCMYGHDVTSGWFSSSKQNPNACRFRPPKARTMLAMTTDDDDDDHRCGCGLASSIPVNSYEYPSERLSRADEHHAIKRPRKHLLTFSPSSSFVHRRSRGHRVRVTRRALLRSWFPPRKRHELRCQRRVKAGSIDPFYSIVCAGAKASLERENLPSDLRGGR